jgi:pimeloyl-ACP methyl ester carboxylesterase
MHYEHGGCFVSAKSLSGDMKISMFNEAKMPRDKRVLIIFGKKDKMSDYKLVRGWAEQAGAEYREIADAGHLINYERPEEVVEQFRKFLR